MVGSDVITQALIPLVESLHSTALALRSFPELTMGLLFHVQRKRK
jgi:hypothetical protein